MVSTRSSTQAGVGDPTTTSPAQKSAFKKSPSKILKGKKLPEKNDIAPSRKRKEQPSPEKVVSKKARTDQENNITINRAPVLKLWAACITHFLHPTLPWSTCLSAGTAISAICAMSKGRSVGKIKERDDDGEKKVRKKQEDDGFETLEVMQFKLRLNKTQGLVYLGGKPQTGSEDVLKKKFGDSYDDVNEVFKHELETWRGKEEEVDEKGFGMYESFRPSVPKGEKGWGRKGVLSLQNIRKVVGRGV
jgi:hypothetical protein